ncbi:hypothetical protein [Rummeliibacillus sp. SL167]|uniref:hypothetical protein n=1 Tax=Rummeliibacillus sp. SL167 TaxID=2579792 RepID=UPI0011B43A24|nr:hypothetical protein [Rummeliibacillus sp. SL167]
MFNYNEYKITMLRKSDLTQEELNLAENYPIITKGEKTSPYYLLKISDLDPIKVLNDSNTPLKKARLEGCRILNEQFDCPLIGKTFKSICFTNYDREKNPQSSYFKLEKR